MIGPFHLFTLLSALGCSAAEEEPGQKPRIGLRQPAGRLVQQKFAKFQQPPVQEPPTCDSVCPSKSFEDNTRREGLGESPGIPNLEYLGLGYNIFEGNPRGSDISEADPGFRSGVIKLVQQQTELTVDQEYMVPLGVDVRYITACKFASKSTELSNESQYQSEISREASQETEVNAGASFGLFSISASRAFSSSEKYKQFTDTTTEQQTVEFEARAMCSEFKATLKPYYTHSLKEEFETALNSLSIPWTSTDDQREEYASFLSAFGTHYVKDVTLGAKHIYSSSIKSVDVTTLSQNEVDIESTLSWSAQASFGGGAAIDPELGQLVRAEGEAEIPGLGSATVYKYIFEEPGAGVGASGSESSSETSSTSSLEKVKSKVVTVNELNVGGNPPEDGNWKTWATTVRDKPMPISYELAGIWTLMHDNQTEAFRDAIVELYNVDLTDKKDSTIIDALRFGVASGNGKAISSYNRDPSSNYRSKIQFTSERGEPDAKFEQTADIVTKSDDELDIIDTTNCLASIDRTDWIRSPDPTRKFGCGMQGRSGNSYFNGLSVVYCDVDDWQVQQTVVVYAGQSGSTGPKRMCGEGQFIRGVRVELDTVASVDTEANEGITDMDMYCAPLGGDGPVTRVIVHSDDGEDGDDVFEEKQSADPNTFLTGVNIRYCDPMGLVNLQLEFSGLAGSGNPSASYKYDISRGDNEIPAIMATPLRGSVGINKAEDENELGFAIKSQTNNQDVLNVISYYPFGEFVASRAKIVVQDFKNREVEKRNLQKFSFLSAKNLPDSTDFVAGVVHPDGYPMNDNFRDDGVGYKISQTSAQEYIIQFDDQPNMEDPTFLAFPLWFPGDDNRFPTSIGSVVVATRKCTSTGCHVVTGAEGSLEAIQNLGFSFIALKGDLESNLVSGIVHGVVNLAASVCEANIDGGRYKGFKIPDAKLFGTCNDANQLSSGDNGAGTTTFTGKTGGILIEFDKPFRGLPSVIINPIIGDNRVLEEGSATDEFAMPYAVVEHISEESVFVKVNWLDTTQSGSASYEYISFHIVAVGPQRDPYLQGSRIY